jgi:CTP:molybdopterin cytidylyltransferase MocA
MSPHGPLDRLGAGCAGPPHALVLAAGQGLRFGGDKLHALYRGRPLLSHALDVVAEGCSRQGCDSGHVVIAVDDEAAQALSQDAGLTAVLNDAPSLGLSHSLQLGLEALGELTPTEGGAVLVFLGDQPLVRLEVAEKVIAAYRSSGSAAVRPRYQAHSSIPGHPILLDRSIWHLARGLQGDRGLAGLLSASVETVTVDVSGDNPDIDTLADLHALEEPSQ